MPPSDLRLDDFIPYRLSFTGSMVSDRIATAYESLFGIDIPQWRVLAWVAEAGAEGTTQQHICARSRMDKVTVSRAAIALGKRGLLDRTFHPRDRRSHLLHLSEAGRTLHAAIAPKALELEQRIFSAFDPQEVADFRAMLRRIDERIETLDAPNA